MLAAFRRFREVGEETRWKRGPASARDAERGAGGNLDREDVQEEVAAGVRPRAREVGPYRNWVKAPVVAERAVLSERSDLARLEAADLQACLQPLFWIVRTAHGTPPLGSGVCAAMLTVPTGTEFVAGGLALLLWCRKRSATTATASATATASTATIASARNLGRRAHGRLGGVAANSWWMRSRRPGRGSIWSVSAASARRTSSMIWSSLSTTSGPSDSSIRFPRR